MNEYTKLGALVGQVFTVEKVNNYVYKKWDLKEKKMLTQDNWEQDFQKKYPVDTDKGKLDLSQSQMAQLLEGVVKDGVADINGRSFQVKSNGKTGMEIRYFLNVATTQPKAQSMQDPAIKAKLEAQRPVEVVDTLSDDPIDLSDIPF